MAANNSDWQSRLGSVLLREDEIAAGIARLAGDLNRDYAGRSLVILSVLKGALVFTADLLRALRVDTRLEWISASSYGSGSTARALTVGDGSSLEIDGRHILIVDTIADSGYTLTAILNRVRARNPASVKTCVCFDKPSGRKTALKPDYRAFEIANFFVAGYGLDFDEHFRNLPYLVVVKTDEQP